MLLYSWGRSWLLAYLCFLDFTSARFSLAAHLDLSSEDRTEGPCSLSHFLLALRVKAPQLKAERSMPLFQVTSGGEPKGYPMNLSLQWK